MSYENGDLPGGSQKVGDNHLEQDLLSLPSAGGSLVLLSADNNNFVRPIEINSQASSVVQLEDNDDAESVSFHIPNPNSQALPSMSKQKSSGAQNRTNNTLDLIQISRDDSVSVLQQKIATLRQIELQNRELKVQVTQTKRILTRLEEQAVHSQEAQLHQIFTLSQTNEQMQQTMLQVHEENQLLREYLADLESEAASNSSKPPMPMSGTSPSPSRKTQGEKQSPQLRGSGPTRVTRKTIALQPPRRQIKLGSSNRSGEGSLLNNRGTATNSSAAETAADQNIEQQDLGPFGTKALSAVKIHQGPSAVGRISQMKMKKRASVQSLKSSQQNGGAPQRDRSSVGILSQSRPYEMTPSCDETSPVALPRNLSLISAIFQPPPVSTTAPNGTQTKQAPVDVYKVVKARQNLLYIQQENGKLQSSDHVDESLFEQERSLKQHHLEIPALQLLLEKTAGRMKEMNVAARHDAHTIAVLRQKLECQKQFRVVEQELEDCEAKLNSLILTTPNNQTSEEVGEESSFEELGSDEGSVGDEETTIINKSVLRRETSPRGFSGRASSPGATFSRRQIAQNTRISTMFGGYRTQADVPSTQRDVEGIAQEISPLTIETSGQRVMEVPLTETYKAKHQFRGSDGVSADTFASSPSETQMQETTGTRCSLSAYGSPELHQTSKLRGGDFNRTERSSLMAANSNVKRKRDSMTTAADFQKSAWKQNLSLRSFFSKPSLGNSPGADSSSHQPHTAMFQPKQTTSKRHLQN